MTPARSSGGSARMPAPPSATARMLWPLRAVRGRLRSIRYHSARRRVSRWTRIMDAALLASPLVALAAALGSNWLPGRATVTTLLLGRAATTDAGRVVVWSLADGATSPVRSMTPVGDFSLSRASIEGGMPFTGVYVDDPPRLDPFRPALRAQPTPPPQVAAAIESFVMEELPPDVAERFRAGEPHRRLSPAGVAANFAVWWLVVLVATWLVVQSLRLLSSIGEVATRRRTERRRRASRCIECGYDVRGSAWSERCPECGAVLGP